MKLKRLSCYKMQPILRGNPTFIHVSLKEAIRATRLLAFIFLCGHLCPTLSADNKHPQAPTLLNMEGAMIMEETFTGTEFPKEWTKGAGDWSMLDNTLHGSQRTSDHHIAFFYRMMPLPNPVVMRCDVRFEGNEVFAFAFNGTIRQDDHLFVISVSKDEISAKAINSKFDKNDLGGQIASVSHDLSENTWHTVTIEVRGPEMVVYVDPQHVLYGTHDKVGRPIGNFGLRIGGDDNHYGSIDNVRIYSARKNPIWDKRKASLK
ncbi:MAG: hypothetical protein KJT03_22225 [Verrucomicrobiae bacterium]|nr:hypothetical protein [Verrucomicrobiae bacterium]